MSQDPPERLYSEGFKNGTLVNSHQLIVTEKPLNTLSIIPSMQSFPKTTSYQYPSTTFSKQVFIEVKPLEFWVCRAMIKGYRHTTNTNKYDPKTKCMLLK